MRGGVPTTMRLTEVLRATEVEDEVQNKWVIDVGEHKRDADGACQVVVDEREMKLLKRWATLRQKLQVLPQFKHDFFLVNLNGGVITKLCNDIQKWAVAKGLKSSFNGELFRRTTGTLAFSKEPEAVIQSVVRQQYHTRATAEKHYAIISKETRVVDNKRYTNMIEAAGLATKAKEIIEEIVDINADNFPAKQELNETLNEKYQADVELSDQWYETLEKAWATLVCKKVLEELLTEIKEGRLTLEEAKLKFNGRAVLKKRRHALFNKLNHILQHKKTLSINTNSKSNIFIFLQMLEEEKDKDAEEKA